MLRMELTLDASGPSDSPPDTMVLTLRIPERSHNVPYLRLDAISRTVEVFGSGDPRRSMPYTSVSVDESLSQIGLPTDVALRTAVAKYLEQMLASAVTPMSAVQSGAASAYEANLTLPWFETFTGSTRVNTGLSQNAQLAVMISGIVATFLTIALWLVHCRMLLTADNLRRQRLIEADGVA